MALWTPANLAVAPHAWFDAQDAGTVTQSGGTVTQWADKSGNGRHLSQATVGRQPGYSSTALGGSYAALTSGGGRILSGSVSITGAAVYALAVGRNDSVGGRRLVALTSGAGDDYNSDSVAALIKTDGSNNASWERNFSSVAGASGDITSPEYAVIECWFDGTNGHAVVNGGTASSQAATGTFNANQLNVLARPVDYDAWEGAVGEVVLLAYAPTLSERQQLEGYAAWRFGLQAQLPSGHPYKAAAPTTGGGAVTHTGTGALAGGGATASGAAARSTSGVTLWTPAYLDASNKLGWYDISDAANRTVSGTDLLTLTDKFGGGFTASSSAGNRPDVVTGASGINGLTAAQFSSTDFLSATLSGQSAGTLVSAVALATFNVSGDFYPTLVGVEQSGGAAVRPLVGYQDLGQIAAQVGGSVYSPSATLPAGATILGGILTATTAQTFVDGTASTSAAATYPSTMTPNRLGLGAMNGGSDPYRGKVGEWIVLKGTVSTADRQRIEGYLAHKWGTTASLPSGHPYKTNAPTAPHVGSGVLTGGGATAAGTATRFRTHTATGALAGGGASLAGTAARAATLVTHTGSGALQGGGATAVGAAARTAASVALHTGSGALVGGGATAAGAGLRITGHTASGVALVGGGAALVGLGAIVRTHTATGALVGGGAVLGGFAGKNGITAYPVGASVTVTASPLGAQSIIAYPVG